MVYANNFKISRLFLVALVIVSMVAFTCYTAPKAQAVAGTLTSVFLMLVMSVMASLGVTLLSSVLDDGIDYLQEQYGLYVSEHGYSSIEEYLLAYGVNSVSKLCVPILGAINVGKTVYDLIADFCSWLFDEENIVSGGSDVGDLPVSSVVGTPRYGYQAAPLQFSSSSNNITLVNQNVYTYGDYYQGAYSPVDGGFNSVTVTSKTNGRYSYTGSSYWSYVTYLLCFVNAPTDVSYYTASTSAVREVINISNVTTPYTRNLSRTYNYIAYCIRPWDARGTSSGTLDIYSPFSVTTTFSLVTGGGFVISPSATVLDPPAVSAGQEYSVSASGVLPTDSVDTAVSTAVAPLTSANGLTTTAEVTGTAIPTEWEWLYEGVEAIEQNTSDDRHGTDFIPNSATVDFGFWHYVPDWISSVGTGFAFFVGLVTSLPSIMLAPLFGILVLGVVVALFHKLWGS